MANDITASPWFLDTTGVITTGFIQPRTLRWVGATTAGHQCILHNAAGRVVWKDEASGANYVSESRIVLPWNGLTLDTLGSGEVYIEID